MMDNIQKTNKSQLSWTRKRMAGAGRGREGTGREVEMIRHKLGCFEESLVSLRDTGALGISSSNLSSSNPVKTKGFLNNFIPMLVSAFFHFVYLMTRSAKLPGLTVSPLTTTDSLPLFLTIFLLPESSKQSLILLPSHINQTWQPVSAQLLRSKPT